MADQLISEYAGKEFREPGFPGKDKKHKLEPNEKLRLAYQTAQMDDPTVPVDPRAWEGLDPKQAVRGFKDIHQKR